MAQQYLGIAGLAGKDVDWRTHLKLLASDGRNINMRLCGLGHDAAAAIVEDGRIVFAAEEERFNRIKHSMGPPRLAERAALQVAGASREALKAAFYLNPNEEHLRERLDCYQASDPRRPGIEADYRDAQRSIFALRDEHPGLVLIDHHVAHAASAYYPSGFARALVLVSDGLSESGSPSLFLGDERGLTQLRHLPLTSSLGVLYARITEWLGFEALEDEYKIMGLAAYGGSEDYASFFDREIVPLADSEYAIPTHTMERARWEGVFRDAFGAPRQPDEPVEPRHIAIAYSMQKAVERVTLRLLTHHVERHKVSDLCLAGGVALNCALNGVIDRTGMFERIFVQPASSDAGTALGAALALYHRDHPGAPHVRMEHVYLGPTYGDGEVKRALDAYADKIAWTKPADYETSVVDRLIDGAVIGWFQGRMEFGSRALGNQSILADPRRADMKERVNALVKKREEFRPFAPSVAAEGAERFFALTSEKAKYEYMTVAVKAKPERAKEIPSVVHVDGTARVHVVRQAVNPGYWRLLTQFGAKTDVPVLLNTSFNVRGEPIVCTPEDAIRCFLGTDITHLAIEGYLVSKR